MMYILAVNVFNIHDEFVDINMFMYKYHISLKNHIDCIQHIKELFKIF